MKKSYLIFCFFYFISQSAISQKGLDSLDINLEQDSIVYIEKAPVIIQRTIEEEEVVFNNWYVDVSVGSFMHSNYHSICSNFNAYKSAMNHQFKPILGNGLGLNIMYRPERSNILFSVGVSTTHFKEKYSKDSATFKSKNKYDYVDVRIGAGYWFSRKKNISLLVAVSLVTSKLINQAGTTLDYVDPTKEYRLEEINRSADWVLSGKLGTKIIFLNNKRLKFYIEPFSQVNFTSILRYNLNYYQRRWGNGVNLGTIFVF